MSGKQRVTRSSSGTAGPSQSSQPSSQTLSQESTGDVGDWRMPRSVTEPLIPNRNKRKSDNLTGVTTKTEAEPRRSVRATKGQHTKSFEALENGPEPKKRVVSKKGKKQAQSSQQEEDEELIRCICGATSQDDDDANEPWIACDDCGAWQHNVCMGMSVFTEDLPNKYFCEQCKPEDHKETLAAVARGERPWETRRHDYESEKKKGKKGKKAKTKRVSDPKERSSPAASSTKAKPSPTPEVKKEENAPESATKGKRKSRDHSQGPQANKMRKVSETEAVPALPEYTPPADIAENIDKLPKQRKGAAQGLKKSLDAAIVLAIKGRLFTAPPGSSKESITERHAIEIERAVHDSHPNITAASNQVRTIMFNLKANIELAARVFNRTLTPNSLAAMSSNDMATKELQRETAEMKARAEKQSILITEEGPRMRKTHKGEEIVEGDNFDPAPVEPPSAPIRRQSVRETAGEAGKSAAQRSPSTTENVDPPVAGGSGPLRVDTQASHQHRQSVDIDKVFSSVRSPSAPQQRRPSAPARPAGPGDDPEVDRLLQDDGTDSPPYSPTENIDPDVVWQGYLGMTNIADELSVVAKHVGGADLSKVKNIPWKSLIPPLLTVAGRIPEEKAVPYLCSLRYQNQIDLVITSLAPANPADTKARTEFMRVIEYFRGKQRYGVVGERKLGNVRDTYLVPVSEGDGPIPEPMQNIGDHSIPLIRPEPMLLMVFVVRDDTQPQLSPEQQAVEMQQPQAPTLTQDRKQSIAQPSWSPATPQQGAFPNSGPPPQQSHTPIPPPVIPGQPAPPPPPQRQTPVATPTPVAPGQDIEALRRAQAEGEMQARQVLGPLFTSPTVTFLLPHASRMKDGEWKAVKRCMERDPRAREDLQLLSRLLTEEGNANKQNGNNQNGQQPQGQPTSASPGVAQSTLAAATAANVTPNSAPVNVSPATEALSGAPPKA